MEKKVRGALFKNFAKFIRANKSGVYEKILSARDMDVINQQILETAWYPFETYKNCLNAISKVETNDEMNSIKQWGYGYGKEMVNRVHKGRVGKKSISLALKSYNALFKLWFNFGNQSSEIVSDNEVRISIEGIDKDFASFYFLAIGWIQSYYETYLNLKVKTHFLKKSWEGADKTIISITW